MASTYLSRATSDPQSSNTTATFSVWLKRSGLGSDQTFWGGSYYSTDNMFILKFSSADKLQVYSKRGASVKASLKTTRLLRDTNAWYHIVIAIDTTQASAADRIKVYINGVQETSFSTNTQPSQDENLYLDSGAGANYYIGQRGGNAEYFDGLMSHFHYVDGSQLAPTVFGETDATTGEWKIKTSPSYTVGTKGFFVLKDGNSGTDQSANSNDFTVGGGTLTKTEDCPSNVFATFNPLDNYYPAMTLSHANTRALTISGKYTYIPTTLGMTSGKYYCEIKCTAQSGSDNYMTIGITSTSSGATTHELGHFANDWGYHGADGSYNNNDGTTSYGASFTTGDIIGIAVDLDNNKLYFSKNGVFQNSGVPTSGSTGTGAIAITDPASTPRGAYFFAVNMWSGSNNATFDANFGNGYFGTTAVSSAGTNASGIGIFEYDVPTGYTALSTKGLNL